MSTARRAPWHNYEFTVKPVEYTRRLHWYGNYWFYGTGQTIAFMLHIKTLKKFTIKDTIICNWFVRKLDEEDVVGFGNFTKDILPDKKIADVKIQTEVIEYPGKYAIELELKSPDDTEFERRRIFVLSIIDRVDFQIQTIATIAIILAVISLIISVIAIIKG